MNPIINSDFFKKFPRGAYVRLDNLPIAAYVKPNANMAGTYNITHNEFLLKDHIKNILSVSGYNIPTPNYFARYIYSRISNYYVYIAPRNLIKVTVTNNDCGGFADRQTNSYTVNYNVKLRILGYDPFNAKIGYIDSVDGQLSTIEKITVAGEYTLGDYINEGEFFGDSVDIVNDITQIIIDNIYNIKKITDGYKAIPLSDEKVTDTTTLTPNTTNDYLEQFNPVGTPSSRDRLHTVSKQTGTQTTKTERSLGVSAKDQIKIVRNLPNIAEQIVSDIKALLIDPRTINDMIDFGLADGYYIDWEEME